jgi:hypothetical protein
VHPTPRVSAAAGGLAGGREAGPLAGPRRNSGPGRTFVRRSRGHAPTRSSCAGDERHLDLRCWMALAARAMATIGANLGLPRQRES